MPRAIKLPAVDQAKVLIGELNAEDLESVITYARFRLQQVKAAKPKAVPPPPKQQELPG